MKESSKVLLGLGLGLVAGGVSGYYLSSKEGREFQRKSKAKLTQISDNLKTKVQENADAVSERISSAASSAKDWASEASKAVKQKVSSATSTAEIK